MCGGGGGGGGGGWIYVLSSAGPAISVCHAFFNGDCYFSISSWNLQKTAAEQLLLEQSGKCALLSFHHSTNHASSALSPDADQGL
jgi:hypothetical protein